MKYTYEYVVQVTLNENDASKFEEKLNEIAKEADKGDGHKVTETDAQEYAEPEPEGDGHDETGEPL